MPRKYPVINIFAHFEHRKVITPIKFMSCTKYSQFREYAAPKPSFNMTHPLWCGSPGYRTKKTGPGLGKTHNWVYTCESFD